MFQPGEISELFPTEDTEAWGEDPLLEEEGDSTQNKFLLLQHSLRPLPRKLSI